MDSTAMSSLAALLRRSGDKIINGESKLILSLQHLSALNHQFSTVIEQRDVYGASFNIIPNRNTSKFEFYADLQFLYEFIQRTLSLKLTTDNNETDDKTTVNISRFKNIKLLDLQKLQVTRVTGIRQLRAQIQFLNCSRSINSLSEVVESCGGDQCSGFVWNDLREAVFCHNSLTHLDGSLQYTPWLITLDLSHNEIVDLEPLNCLENLKHLNVGYNKITTVPVFNDMISTGLQVLVLRSNFLDHLPTSLSQLPHLRDLDLADNCLLDHHTLAPLAHLLNLQRLTSEGNPLSYHPRHRDRTCACLHKDVATVRFVLDGKELVGREMDLVGMVRPILMTKEDKRGNVAEGEVQIGVQSVGRRPRKVRDAVISDSDDDQLTDSIAAASLTSLNHITSSYCPDDDHLATKRQIEQLREQYGDDWLKAQAGSLVQEALGLEPSVVAQATLSSTPYDSDFMLHAAEVDRKRGDGGGRSLRVTAAVAGSSEEVMDGKEVAEGGGSGEGLTLDTSSSTIYLPPQPSSTNLTNHTKPHEAAAEEQISDDDEIAEGEQNLYLATVEGAPDDPVCVIVTRTHLTERECTRTRERARWPLGTLLRCVWEAEAREMTLEFDTMRSDRKQRRYIIDDLEEAERLKQTLQEIVERNSADESKFISYTCMKCSTKFNIEKVYEKKTTVSCPSCNSTIAIQEN